MKSGDSFSGGAKGGFAYFGPIKHSKSELRIFDTDSLHILQRIGLKRDTVIDAAATRKRLFLSGFEKIYIYIKE